MHDFDAKLAAMEASSTQAQQDSKPDANQVRASSTQKTYTKIDFKAEWAAAKAKRDEIKQKYNNWLMSPMANTKHTSGWQHQSKPIPKWHHTPEDIPPPKFNYD